MTYYNKGLRIAAVGLVAVLIALLAWVTVTRSVPAAEAQTGTAAPRPAAGFQLTPAQWASLTIAPANHINFDTVVMADGVIATNDNTTAAVFSPYSGRVTSIQAQLGQMLHKGAPLATVLAVEAAQSDSDLAAAAAAEAIARRQVELAKATEHRQHELLLAEAGAQKDWLQSQADLAAAENALRSAVAALAAVRTKAAILDGSSAKRVGAVSSEAAHTADGVGSITSPIDGVVVQRQIAPGEFVNSLAGGGGTPLFTISDLRTVWVLASVGEADAVGLKVGATLDVSALALPGRMFHARIAWIASVVDPATHRVAVRAELPNPDLVLKPQMTVTVRLFQGHPVDGVAIARSAVVYEGQEAHCYVVVADRTLVARKLQVGRIQGSVAEVTSGLAAGERVVTRGTLFLDGVANGDNT